MKTINNIIQEFVYETYGRRVHIESELVLGYLRYKALKKLNLRQYEELNKRNLNGENFDEMVDELILKK